MIRPDLDALAALLAYVRELERKQDVAALAMRERCAQECERISGKALRLEYAKCAAAIRALET